VNPITRDAQLVRRLAEQVVEIAHLPIQDEKRALWRATNSLRPARPLAWINQIPWDEIQDEELAPQAEDGFARSVEKELRTTLYLWRHMRTDMVVDGVFFTPYVYHDTGFGLDVQMVQGADGEAGMGSHNFVSLINSEADIERIQLPRITADWEATERRYAMTCELLGAAMPVEKRGIVHLWTAPWDILIQWWGTQRLFYDMLDRPAFVHAGIGRMMDAFLARLDQFEALGLLSVGNGNFRPGSGGFAFNDELPQPDFDGVHVRTIDQWGTSTGQIFSEVSPAMHDEFCLQHELRWLRRFGLNAYGCCEPLHDKIGILKQVPRLRRLSMSRWINVDKAAEAVGHDYVFSYRPNPAVFAWDTWQPEAARAELVNLLQRTRGCVVDFTMKDITTCRHDPRRLWEWCELAVQVAEEYAY
jgi:hypothetical protein